MVAWPTTGGSEGTWNDEMKAFVDVAHNADGTLLAIEGDIPVSVDSESNAMLKSHAYLTQTSGFVTAFTDPAETESLRGFVGTTNDPAGVGTKVADSRIQSSAGGRAFVSFFVGLGKFFEITTSGTVDTITWTPFVPSGGNPVDQD